MRKKAEEQAAPATGDARVTPADVQQVEFRLAFRGYNERDVDAFLDRVTEDLASYIEENQRLRAGRAVAPDPGDPATARAEADRIVAGARVEAARIVGEAEAHAAVTGATTGDARAAVAPFLNTEREFLQSLGALVQEHAEEIKQMVLTLRAKTEGAIAPSPDTDGTEGASRTPDAGSATTAAEEPVRAEEEPTREAEGEEPTREAEEAFAPIEVPESDEVTAGVPDPASEPTAAKLRRDSGERSLRELFWGED